MIQHEALTIVRDFLLQRNLGEAMAALDNFLAVHPHQINTDRLFAIKTDYQLMTDYWRHGFKDPQLPHLYNDLLKRMYVLYANIACNYTVRHMPFLASLFSRAHMSARDWSPLVIQEELESFVADVAMLDLEPDHTSEEKRKDVYARHHISMAELFDYIVTSGIWNDSFSAAMEKVLLSPTVESRDQQIIISSVMLSAMSYFDMAKFRLLVKVYRQTTDEHVRQRALIGWSFSLDAQLGNSIYPEELTLVQEILEDEHCRQELVELQKQLIYCISTEKDNATIQNEIMPDLMKQQGFHFTKDGIIEKAEDTLQDILHPDETEKNLEQMESSFQKMVDMQKQGSDIYFGGFSQMKRFPFFNEIANWFTPFYNNHPDIQTAVVKFRNNRFLKMMMKSSPFCDSDKYSFLLSFEQISHQMPPRVMEMLDRGEASFNEVAMGDMKQPAYIRRTYLQDLYRFFRIFPQRNAFSNIFDHQEQRYLLFASDFFSGSALEKNFNEITAFLIKKKRLNDASAMTRNYSEHARDYEYEMMTAYLMPASGDKWEHYQHALDLKPDSEKAMAGIARAAFASHSYEVALKYYSILVDLHPDSKIYLLNKAICHTNLREYDEAEKLLFRLNYELPDDLNVVRGLAWTLTCHGKYEQADRLYSQLLSTSDSVSDDVLNQGYFLWFSGRIDEAADCFRHYLQETGQRKQFIIENEKRLIKEKGITEAEIQMMLYVL